VKDSKCQNIEQKDEEQGKGAILMTEKVSNQSPAIETSIIYEAKSYKLSQYVWGKKSGTMWKDEIEYTN
jgi:hypothetical protein